MGSSTDTKLLLEYKGNGAAIVICDLYGNSLLWVHERKQEGRRGNVPPYHSKMSENSEQKDTLFSGVPHDQIGLAIL